MINLPKPHGEKLIALLNNEKLPKSDMLRIEKAINEYQNWRNKLININNDVNTFDLMIKELNEYKKYIDVDLIFDSENDFLYRQSREKWKREIKQKEKIIRELEKEIRELKRNKTEIIMEEKPKSHQYSSSQISISINQVVRITK